MVRDWLTKKVSRTIEAAVEPTKEAIRKTVEEKSDWGAKLLKLGLLAFLTLIAFRDEGKAAAVKEAVGGVIPNIVINNYIRDERSKEDG